jgi:hypothetical protein
MSLFFIWISKPHYDKYGRHCTPSRHQDERASHHLGGPTCVPPVSKLVAGFDPVAVDACGVKLLGIPWEQVGHIKMADGILGSATGKNNSGI